MPKTELGDLDGKFELAFARFEGLLYLFELGGARATREFFIKGGNALCACF